MKQRVSTTEKMGQSRNRAKRWEEERRMKPDIGKTCREKIN
jgi:hypothetical protein